MSILLPVEYVKHFKEDPSIKAVIEYGMKKIAKEDDDIMDKERDSSSDDGEREF